MLWEELGQTGLNRFGRWIDDEYLPDLKGKKAIKVYTEMGNDAVVGAALLAIELLVRQVEWRVDPASSKKADRDDAKFIEESLHDMETSWADVLGEVLSMNQFGFSFHELVYKKRNGLWANNGRSKFSDGFISWKDWPIRSQSSLHGWLFDEHGRATAFIQMPPPKYEYITIPMEKGLLFRPSTNKNNPEGKSMLRRSYRAWYLKKRIEEIEGIGVDRDLAGMPIAHVDPQILAADASADEKALLAAIRKLVKDVRNDQSEGMVFPRVYDENSNLLYEFGLLTSGGGRAFSTDAIIQRWDQRIAMTLLADWLLLGHEKVGSFALSSDKTDIFATALGAILQSIADVINRQAVPRLFRLNGWEREALPEVKFEDIESPDLSALGQYLTSLTGAGVPLFPDDELENYLRSAAHLPPKSEAAVKQQAEQAAMDQANAPGGQPLGGQPFGGGFGPEPPLPDWRSPAVPRPKPAASTLGSNPGNADQGATPNG